MTRDYLNILNLCEHGTKELGPGLRYGIWVQGCPFRCKGCITPEGLEIKANQIIPINQIVENILEKHSISGITISGGEPFMQASALATLIKAVRDSKPDLSVIVFTGFNRGQLDWPEAKELMSYTDVLIDGKYVESLNDNIGLRGSSNQDIHFLTDRLKPYEQYFHSRIRSIEVHMFNTHQRVIGIPNREITF